MTWQVRHEGSPQSVELPLEVIRQGVLDGVWEPTDEVKGPQDTDWVAIENHPELEETAAEIEEEPARFHDESHLDMTALIDVCLVLLVFFILTTSVAALQKRLEAPTVEDTKHSKIAVVTKDQIEKNMVYVTARMEDGEPVIRVENEVVAPNHLLRTIKKYVNATRTDLLLEHDNLVPIDFVVQIIDKAKGAGVNRVRLVVP
jgi:biopolymer transport protein ExbD